MSSITVFDPAMCCSSGVCGPKPDQKLSVFSADLSYLETLGHRVTRHNLAQEAAAFAANLTVKAMLEAHQTEALPIIMRDGEMVATELTQPESNWLPWRLVNRLKQLKLNR